MFQDEQHNAFRVTFENGTSRQRELFERTLVVALWPFNRTDTSLHVYWDVDPNPNVHNEFAWTSWHGHDVCGRGGAISEMHIRDDLEEPRPGSPVIGANAPRGVRWYQETVMHELGHIIAGHLKEDEQERISAMFGVPFERWGNPDFTWADRPDEAFAETFKDVFLPPGERRFANRTNLKLPLEYYDPFLDIFDNICDCFIT